MDWNRWPDELRPKIRMFVSADIVGSTALKQTTIDAANGIALPDNSKWFDTIQNFYIQSVNKFFENFDAQNKDKSYLATMQRPVVWKTIGDEILFWMEVSDSRQVFHYLNAWINTVDSIRADLKQINARLDLKCTAWMAHFPWRNKMIFSSRSGFTGAELDHVPDNNLQLMQIYLNRNPTSEFDLIADFVGPGIDIGFRLASQATNRRFIISTDIAYMLAEAARTDRSELPFKVHFDGLQQFRGILGGLEYPVFWIDMANAYAIDSYGNDLSKRQKCERIHIKEFCEAFYDERSNYLYTPFIISKTERSVRKIPEWYVSTHEQMLKEAGFSPVETS